MLSKDGEFLAYTDSKRMNWYLERKLASKVDGNIYQLNFETKNGNKNRGDFYKIALKNKCVVCGTNNELTKHHVVPSQYRKLLPEKYKSKSSFDVVSICHSCHRNYEYHAEDLNKALLVKYGLESNNKINSMILSRFSALKFFGDVMSKEKKLEYTIFLTETLGDTIENILKKESFDLLASSVKIMGYIDSVEEFIIMWREHFMEKAKPKHLYKEWIDNIKTQF